MIRRVLYPYIEDRDELRRQSIITENAEVESIVNYVLFKMVAPF